MERTQDACVTYQKVRNLAKKLMSSAKEDKVKKVKLVFMISSPVSWVVGN